jgi:hypothetical protein
VTHLEPQTNRAAARAAAPGGLVRPPLDPAGARQHQAAGGYEPGFCAGARATAGNHRENDVIVELVAQQQRSHTQSLRTH